LVRIRDLRAQEYDKTQIAELLGKEFAISVDELERKAEVHRKQDDARDAVYLAMQAVGEMADRLEGLDKEQKQMRQDFEERIEKQDEYIKTSLDERDRKLTEHMRQLQEERKRRNVLQRIKNAFKGVFKE
jgi:ABC-type phosphate transport system auxiliary subunit